MFNIVAATEAVASSQPQASHFSLTDIQQAYWFGEQNILDLHTAAFFHRTVHVQDLSMPRLQAALQQLVSRHEILRTRFHPDGTQSTLKVAPEIQMLVVGAQAITDRSEWLKARLPALDSGCPILCVVEATSPGHLVHFALRLIALDGRSLALFFSELAQAYAGRLAPAPERPRYADHVALRQAQRESTEYRDGRQYWLARLDTLAGPPQLPLLSTEGKRRAARFTRLEKRLPCSDLDRLTQLAGRTGVSLSVLLCTAYADVLRKWSATPSFTINLLISARPTEPDGFGHVLGNFSSTLPLEVRDEEVSFKARAQALQKQMYFDLPHLAFSGVEVTRAMKRAPSAPPAMPVVFASALGLIDDDGAAQETGWVICDESLQTPQVWLDHQAYLRDGELVLSWDVAEGVFPAGVPAQMFEVYQAHLATLLTDGVDTDDALLPQLPKQALRAREAANDTAQPLPTRLLHEFFNEACQRSPGHTAIIAPDRSLSFEQLQACTQGLAVRLRQLGVGPNTLVAIIAPKGWQQVAATMAVLQAGGAYLPVSTELPPARQSYLVARPGVAVVLIAKGFGVGLDHPPGVQVLSLDDALLPAGAPTAPLASVQGANDLAYVIFTSGSTGEPKGVAISHKGAVNTVQDVIRRFGLTPDDKVLALSAFNFDLSVYDIFATLGTGATLVIPPASETPSPRAWAQCVRDHGVTVWNSVPALLDMQLEFLGERAIDDLRSLRLVMLSGDWIPVNLPGKLSAAVPHAKLVAMGGATEASIWSNYFEVGLVDPAWASIPYGWPLSNQSYHVLDRHLQHAPAHVAGDLYIGGKGLAKGYHMDPALTAESFVFHPDSGERLYRTGDLGRYDDHGCIEFLGRKDTQVKIRGFRIELGEIEASLERCPGVRSGAVTVRKSANNDASLVAFYESCDGQAMDEAVLTHMRGHLPEYMVPQTVRCIARLPITANGKIDRKVLADMTLAGMAQSSALPVLPASETERRLIGLWSDVLGLSVPSVHSNFFELGGTSLAAVRLLVSIERAFQCELPLVSLFRHGSVAAQAVLIDAPRTAPGAAQHGAVVSIREGGPHLLLVVHPVGGHVLCYRPFAELAPAGLKVLGLQSRGDGQPRSLTSMARAYIDELAPHLAQAGSLQLVGWSMGGMIAHEMTRLLEAQGVEVARLVMIDSWMGLTPPAPPPDDTALMRGFLVDSTHGGFLEGDLASQAAATAQDTAKTSTLFAEYKANYLALTTHRPGHARAATTHYRSSMAQAFPALTPFETTGDLMVVKHLPDDHFSIMSGDALRLIAAETMGTFA